MVQAAVIRDVASGIVPQRQNVSGRPSFNLMKSETLVWTTWYARKTLIVSSGQILRKRQEGKTTMRDEDKPNKLHTLKLRKRKRP